MANEDHLKILNQGVEAWNQWRQENPDIGPDLTEADLENLYKEEVAARITSPITKTMFLSSKGYGADLTGINFNRTNLWGARLKFVNLTGADLSEVDFTRSNLRYANLSHANLTGARLYEADLYLADLTGAKLHNTNLLRTILVSTNLEGASLENCLIHGTSVWGVKLNEHTFQRDLIVFDPNNPETPAVKVDDLEIAQFIYLLLDNKKIRHVIDTITAKVVLILGRFTPQRKLVLDAIRDELRQRDYLPIIFDFEQPASRDLTETVSTLAHMARFIIADLTDAKSIPQELQRIVPDLPSVPVQPLIATSDYEYALFEHFRNFPWVLEVHQYDSQAELLAALEEKVITPAETKATDIATHRQAAIDAEARKLRK